MTQTANILRHGNFASIEERYADVVESELQLDQIQCASDETDKLRTVVKYANFFAREQNGRVIFPAGCCQRLRRRLIESGVSVSIRSTTLREKCRSINESERNEGVDETLRLAVQLNRCGVILAPRGRKRNTVIGQICALYSDALIFVACATKDRLNELVRDLASTIPTVKRVRGSNWLSEQRVTCGTMASLASLDSPDLFDIVMFEDVSEAGCRGHTARVSFSDQNVYAFADHQSLSDATQRLRSELLAGPVIYETNVKSNARREAIFARYVCPVVATPADLSESRRRVWGLKHRNEAIASLATGVAERNTNVLNRYGVLPLAEQLSQQFCVRIAVIVDNPGQAHAISSLLPDWAVFPGAEAHDIQSARFIITSVAAQQSEDLHAGYVVNCLGDQAFGCLHQ